MIRARTARALAMEERGHAQTPLGVGETMGIVTTIGGALGRLPFDITPRESGAPSPRPPAPSGQVRVPPGQGAPRGVSSATSPGEAIGGASQNWAPPIPSHTTIEKCKMCNEKRIAWFWSYEAIFAVVMDA